MSAVLVVLACLLAFLAGALSTAVLAAWVAMVRNTGPDPKP